jgi:hypothetical protein
MFPRLQLKTNEFQISSTQDKKKQTLVENLKNNDLLHQISNL